MRTSFNDMADAKVKEWHPYRDLASSSDSKLFCRVNSSKSDSVTVSSSGVGPAVEIGGVIPNVLMGIFLTVCMMVKKWATCLLVSSHFKGVGKWKNGFREVVGPAFVSGRHREVE